MSRHVERHDFLFVTSTQLPDTWEHVVRGSGHDSGERFKFQWITSGELYRIDIELQKFVDSVHLPEFFE